MRRERGQEIVASCCGHAARAGVHAGMNLAHARALLAGKTPHVAPEDTFAQTKWLLALARWIARRWSPVVSVNGDDGLLLDITGCSHLFGGERGLVDSIERALRRSGLSVRTGVAGTVGAAWAVARYATGEERSVAHGREREALAPLPVAALRVDPEIVDSLREVGIERIGQLLDVPRQTLPSRYDTDLLHRIDQALGWLPETIQRLDEPTPMVVSRELPGGTTQVESVALTLQHLLAELVEMLARAELGVRRLEIHFDRLDSASENMIAEVTRPTRDAKHLWSLIRPRTERLHMGYGIERITLHASRAVRIPHTQATISGEREQHWEHEETFAALIDTLRTRLGHDAVTRPELLASHRPERAFRLVPIEDATRWAEAPGLAAARPSRLLDHPAPAEAIALSPDGPILRLRMHAAEHRIVACLGPERIGPEWWRGREPTRDYYRVQNEHGRWLWVFRDLQDRGWFVHGEWR